MSDLSFDGPVDPSERWTARGACRSASPELFFPNGTTGLAVEDIQAAKAICASCPVRPQCLRFAVETGQDFGIWGGTTEDERRELRRHWLRRTAQRNDAPPRRDAVGWSGADLPMRAGTNR